MIAEEEAAGWRLRECIRLRGLAATHRHELMRRLRMLEEQEAWKREAGFDRIEIITEIDSQPLRAGFDSEPLYTKLDNPRWLHSLEEHKLDMDVEIERLGLETLLSQPAPSPQDDVPPRQSPAVGMGSEEPGLPRAGKQSMEREGIFIFQASLDGCTSLDQEGTTKLLQIYVGVKAETATSE